MIRKTAPLLAALWLFGCDAGNEPFKRAAEAEAAGKLGEAKGLYAEVCAKAADSPLCPVAKRRAAQLGVKEAYKHLAEGQYKTAKELLDAAAGAEDAGVKRAATAALTDPELTAGLAWEEASTATDKAKARAKMDELAAGHSAVAPRAREWLGKNAPSILLAEMKSACRPDGQGSCVELGEKMATMYATSPEAAEAARLVDEEYKRTQPLLKQAERLLIQRLEVYNKKARYDLCVRDFMPAPGGTAEYACAGSLEMEPSENMFSTRVIEQYWDKKLEEIHDPGHIKRLKERYSRIEDKGEYDPEPWPKPGEKPKQP